MLWGDRDTRAALFCDAMGMPEFSCFEMPWAHQSSAVLRWHGDIRDALFCDAMEISELTHYYSTDTDNSISHLHQSIWQDCPDGLRISSAPSVDGLPLKFQ